MQLAFRRLITVLDDDSPSAGVFAYCAVFGCACALAVVASIVGVPLGTAVTLLMLVIGAVLLFLAACAYEAARREGDTGSRGDRAQSRQPARRPISTGRSATSSARTEVS